MTDIDPFLKSSQVARARSVSTRWLYDLVQRNEFPGPDRRATKKGEPNLWRMSTVKRALDELQASAGNPLPVVTVPEQREESDQQSNLSEEQSVVVPRPRKRRGKARSRRRTARKKSASH